MAPPTNYWQTVDAGHWGPGYTWMFYGLALTLEALGVCYIFRRRYMEPIGMMVAGTLIWLIHVLELMFGHCDSLSKEMSDAEEMMSPYTMCLTKNIAHIGIGVYVFLVGVFEFILHTPTWQKRAGITSPPHLHQYPFLIPSCFFVIGLVMQAHPQSNDWQTTAHTMSSNLALLLFIVRGISYQYPGFLLAAGLAGLLGGLTFANASSRAYHFWYSTENIFGTPLSFHNLTLYFAVIVLTMCIIIFALVTFLSRFEFPFVTRCSQWLDLRFDRLDLAESHHHYPYSVEGDENSKTSLMLDSREMFDA